MILTEREIQFLLNGHNHNGRNSKYIPPNIPTALPAVSTLAPTVGNGGPGRIATVVVAAVDSNDLTRADFVCKADTTPGNGDEVTINQAIATLPAGGGEVLLLDGNYFWSNTVYSGGVPTYLGRIIVPENSTLRGLGPSSIIHLPAQAQLDACIVMMNNSLIDSLQLNINRGSVFFDTPYAIATQSPDENSSWFNQFAYANNLFVRGENYTEAGVITSNGIIGRGITLTNSSLQMGPSVFGSSVTNVAASGWGSDLANYNIQVAANNNSFNNCILTLNGNGITVSNNFFTGSGYLKVDSPAQCNINNNFFLEFTLDSNSIIINRAGHNFIGNYLSSSGEVTINAVDYIIANNYFHQSGFLGLQGREGLISNNYFYTSSPGGNIIIITGNNNIVINNSLLNYAGISDSGTGNVFNLDGSSNNWNAI